MANQSRVIAVAVILAAAAVVASCDGSSPTSPRPSVNTPSPPAAVTVVRIEVQAPASIEPDATVQLKANAVKSDGSTEDITTAAQWSSSDTRVLQVTAGSARGRARGEADVIVRYQGRTASARVLVLPNGTFRLDGVITDAGFPLQGARVEVIAGTGAGLTASSNGSGGYALYGVAGDVKLHLKKDGYTNQARDVRVTEHQSLNVGMTLDRARPMLAGTYRLEIEAVGCSNRITMPDSARRRAYTAIVEQNGPRLSVRLTGADFILSGGKGDHFDGVVEGSDDVRFELGGSVGLSYYYYYYYFFNGTEFDLVERLDSSSAFLVSGTVVADVSSSGMLGSLRGWLALTQDVTPPFSGIQAVCFSTGHRFEMRRQ
jgi:hypothetical protein